jgi:hypothetical protein
MRWKLHKERFVGPAVYVFGPMDGIECRVEVGAEGFFELDWKKLPPGYPLYGFAEPWPLPWRSSWPPTGHNGSIDADLTSV